MSERLFSRRSALGVLSALTVGGCAGFSKTSPFWGTIRAGVSPEGGPSVTREYVDKLPYASMLAWFHGAPPALIVLAEITANGQWIWNSADRQAITTVGPFVVGLVGFDRDLRGTRLQGNWGRDPRALVGREMTRLLDIAAEAERTELLLTSRFIRRGSDTVDILGVEHRLETVYERVSARGRHRFTNCYWVDPASGRCLKSRQTVIPTLPEFNIEVLKYPNA